RPARGESGRTTIPGPVRDPPPRTRPPRGRGGYWLSFPRPAGSRRGRREARPGAQALNATPRTRPRWRGTRRSARGGGRSAIPIQNSGRDPRTAPDPTLQGVSLPLSPFHIAAELGARVGDVRPHRRFGTIQAS